MLNKLNIICPINRLGYGIHSYQYCKALYNAGFHINWTPIGPIDCHNKEFIDKLNRKFEYDNPTILLFHESHMSQATGQTQIGFFVFECDLIDDYTRILINQLDAAFVTSSWAQQVLLDNEIEIPIYVIKEGVDSELYYPYLDKYIDTGKFTFINVGKHELRKNTDMILECFCEEFGDKEAALIMHSYNFFTKKYANFDVTKHGFTQVDNNERFMKYTKNACDIYLTKPIDESLGKLYSSADIGIYPSRAEGWNLPLIETLACGIPCIATNCTGQSEYLDNNIIKKLQGDLLIEKDQMTLEPAHDGFWFKNGKKGRWHTFDKSLLKQLMVFAYLNHKTFDGHKISKYISKNFSWDKTAERTKGALDAICRESI